MPPTAMLTAKPVTPVTPVTPITPITPIPPTAPTTPQTATAAADALPAPSAGVLPRPWAVGLASTALVWPALAGLRWGPQRPVSGLWFWLLRKPGFQPPNAVIPLAWTLIDTALAVGAYRLLRRPASAPRNQALGWWALNVGLIGGWSGVFFGRRNLQASTALAAAMVGSGVAYVASARKADGPAAAAGVPFIAWVAFATVLTAALWRRNR